MNLNITAMLGSAALSTLLAIGACADDFESYNTVSGLRILAIASDRPDVLVGEVATFSALITDPTASYQWTWCPLPSPASDGLECVVTDEELASLIDISLGDDGFEAPPLDLGTGETASFENRMDPQQGRVLCEALVALLPEGAERPACLGAVFPLSIKLKVRSADGQETVTGVRTLNVLMESQAVANVNPIFSEVSYGPLGDATTLIVADGSTTLDHDRVYELNTNATEDSAEPYWDTTRGEEPIASRESLVVSWFTEVGEFKLGRSSYLEGERPIEQLNTNEWSIPLATEDERSTSRVWFVLRDGRGGVSWIERSVSIGGGS